VTALLEGREIFKTFGGTRVLDAVTFSIAPGEAVGLFGPNGSGKTTLVNILSGLTPADGGTVRFGGRTIDRLPMDARHRAGIARTFQVPAPYPALSVLEAVLVPMAAASPRVRGGGHREDREAARELLRRVGLFDQRSVPCARLSQGSLRRLELGRALACRPKVLLLDEIFSALSASDEKELVALLAAVKREEGTAYLLVSHNPPLLASMCTRILTLKDGRITRERTV
jgi:branched-chain amino acid transport system ATP-binding protein